MYVADFLTSSILYIIFGYEGKQRANVRRGYIIIKFPNTAAAEAHTIRMVGI